jgi:hypothetical protein
LLLAFLVNALYFLNKAFANNSTRQMLAFSLSLYLAMLSHYSAFLFAAALGVYALIRMGREHPSGNLIATWAIGQLGALAIALILYKTHLSKLGVGISRTALQGWMSEFYLRHSYFDSAHDNPLIFVLARSFGVFQYFFGQLAVGDVMGVFFVVGLVSLLLGKPVAGDQHASRGLGWLLLLAFAIAAGASLAHVYPYGGTRHVAFLIIPGVTGVSVAIARLAAGGWPRALVITTFVIVACVAFGKTRQPRMDRADQSRAHMTAAVEFVKQNVTRSDLVFSDYQTDLVLGHYLCNQRPISFEAAPATFEQYSCGGFRLAPRDYSDWVFVSGTFVKEWQELVRSYDLKPGDRVWVVQAGWETTLPEDLRRDVPAFHGLRFESFGNNIKIFKMTVGQPMPAANP